jgi:hypothetical protein
LEVFKTLQDSFVPEYSLAGFTLEANEADFPSFLVALPLDDPATRKIQFSSPGPSLPIAAVATSSYVFINVPRQPDSRK